MGKPTIGSNKYDMGIISLFGHARKPPLNAHVYISSRTRGLNFGQSVHLDPYFVYASSEGSGEYAQRRIA